MLCRRGGVRKQHIGSIDIGRRETRFQIAPQAADEFDAMASKRDDRDPNVVIERLEASNSHPNEKPQRAQRPVGRKPARRAPIA